MSVTEFISSLVKPKSYHVFGMKVKIISHGVSVGYGHKGVEKTVIVEPVDPMHRQEWGDRIHIWSDRVYREFRDGDEAFLPFTENPDYDPKILDSQKVVIRNDLL